MLANPWWSLALLVPLVLLAVLGLRGIRAGQRETLVIATAEANRAVEYSGGLFESRMAILRTSARRLRLYPLIPQPAGDIGDIEAVYERALAAPPKEADALFTELLAARTDAVTHVGLPLAPLIRWARLKNADLTRSRIIEFDELASDAVENHPSILTGELLRRAEALAVARGIDWKPVSFQERWNEDEMIRGFLRRAEQGSEKPVARWLGEDSNSWWVEPDDAYWRPFRRDALAELAREVVNEVAPMLPNPIVLSISWGGNDLHVVPAAGETLAQKASGPLVISAKLIDPPALYRQQRSQTFWLVALLALALITILAGFFAMQRALVSERQLNTQKSDFVASVSHELRAPVASMRLMLENLESGVITTDSSRRDYLRLLTGECRRLSALIENILDFARIEHDRKIYHFVEADIPAMVQDAVDLLRPGAARRRQTLDVEITPIDPVPKCDALAIQQVVINLVDNAIKFSPDNSRILVSVGPRDKLTWQLVVADQGPGIPECEHRRIFERFYRIGCELRREVQGAGIGLSIVKHTVEAHRGRIELESTPGNGARFGIILPMGI